MAKRRYTVKPGGRLKLIRRSPVEERKGKGLLTAIGCNSFKGLDSLRSAGFVNVPKCCLACKGALAGPTDRGKGSLYFRCTRYSCRAKYNALSFSRFAGTKLTPAQVALIAHTYTNLDNIAPPPVNNLAALSESSQRPVEKIVAELRAMEVRVAKADNEKGQLSGDVEVDEHGVRSMHISKNNAKFKKYVPKRLDKRGCKYYLNYIRVIGARRRGGGKVYLKVLPPKPLPPRSKPPPLSSEELVACRILKRMRPRATVVHSDGAHAYPLVIKKQFKKLRHRSVSHKDMQFVKRVPSFKLPGGRSAKLTGTQCIDSTWSGLDASVPKTLKTKTNHDINPLLFDYVYSWLYRVNRPASDGFQCLGKYFRQRSER